MKLSEATPIMPPKKRESLTAAQHLAKYGANEAFYTEYDEGARIVCATLPYCRLRADNRRKVLEYLVCVSDKSAERHCFVPKPHALFRADEVEDRAPPKPVCVIAGVHVDVPLSRGVLKKSTAADVDALMAHSAVCRTVCKTMLMDYNSLRNAPPAINRAVPRAWLEHLYCRPSAGLDDSAVKQELIARQKVGKAANLSRDLLRRAAASLEFRSASQDMAYRPSGEGEDGKGVTIFNCPATWSDAQKSAARTLLGTHQLDGNDTSKGLAMTHSRVLTLDEANGYAPCDREQLTELLECSVNGVAKRLRGLTLTCLVTNVTLLNVNESAQNDHAPEGPVDYDAVAAEIRGILDHLSDHRLATAWTNKELHPYGPYELRKARFNCEDFRAQCHDSSRPPIQSYAELLRFMVEQNIYKACLDADGTQQTSGNNTLRWGTDYDSKTPFMPQGAARVDITVAPTALAACQTFDSKDKKNPFAQYYFIGVSSLKGTGAASAFLETGEGNLIFKVDTHIFHERVNFAHGNIFRKFANGRFMINMSLRIPGMD